MQFTGSGFDIKVIPTTNDPNSANKTVRTESEGFDLPSSIQFGVAWNALQNNEMNNLEFSGTFQSNNFSQDEFKAAPSMRIMTCSSCAAALSAQARMTSHMAHHLAQA